MTGVSSLRKQPERRMGSKIKKTGKAMVKPKLRKRQGRERRKGHRARHMMRTK